MLQVQTPLFFREFLKKCKNVCSETIIFHNNSSICSISFLYLAEDLTFFQKISFFRKVTNQTVTIHEAYCIFLLIPIACQLSFFLKVTQTPFFSLNKKRLLLVKNKLCRLKFRVQLLGSLLIHSSSLVLNTQSNYESIRELLSHNKNGFDKRKVEGEKMQ